MTDWGIGEYELTAQRLEPAAEVAVAALAPQPGERIADVACGTGNAALLAARAGASAFGADTAARLVDVARRRAAGESLDATFEVADAVALPVEDGAFDGAVSVFGVIFADADAAARELVRIVRPGGRIVLTTWTTDGATARAMRELGSILGGPPPKARWSDPGFLRDLFAPRHVEIDLAEIAFSAESPEAYVAEQAGSHPLWISTAPRLRELGREEEATAAVTRVFAEANEDPAAFRTTSRYHVVKVER